MERKYIKVLEEFLDDLGGNNPEVKSRRDREIEKIETEEEPEMKEFDDIKNYFQDKRERIQKLRDGDE